MEPPDHTDADSRAQRLERERRGRHRRTLLVTIIVIVVAIGSGVAAYAIASKTDSSSAGAAGTTPVSSALSTAAPTTTIQPTTTTTIPPVVQPKNVRMPALDRPLGYGSRGPIVQIYEARMKQLHFDPGPVDGVFDQDTQYAVIAVEKYAGLTRDGSIGPSVQLVLSAFRYKPAEPKSEADRVEIDLDRQVLTVYTNWQPILISTVSTGSGERFCGGVDGCQYAITPAGHFHFYQFHKGWQKGKLGTMWNPYYFNGGIAVHGLQSVPAHPASHGCTRVPMHVADYFYTLVHHGESVFVVGTPMKRGSGYVGPIKNAPTTVPPSTTTPTTIKAKAKPKTTTTKPKTTTTKPKTTTT